MLSQVISRLNYYKKDIFNDLSNLISIDSKYDEATKSTCAPFGIGVKKCFDLLETIAIRENMSFSTFDGYAMHIDYGSGTDIFGILCHTDIVGIFYPNQWTFNPFELTEKDDHWYGRGVNDNKGMIIAFIYLFKILKELNYIPNMKLRLIIGGAEETSWECMKHYFKHNPMPLMGFSPDGDFPIINCEKGISLFEYVYDNFCSTDYSSNEIQSITTTKDFSKVCSDITVRLRTSSSFDVKSIKSYSDIKINRNYVDITYKGKSAKSRSPHKGENAIFSCVKSLSEIHGLSINSKALLNFLNTYFVDSINGHKLGIAYNDPITGSTTSNLSYVVLENSKLSIGFDYRFPNGVNYAIIKEKLHNIAKNNNMYLKTVKERPLHYVSEDSQLIKLLKTSYYKITNEECTLHSKGASSYARVLDNGVAFGPTFSPFIPHSHSYNECMKIDDFFKALHIYADVLLHI